MTFKERLKTLREEQAIKQKELAAECDLSPQCISQLETGTRNPTGSTLVALADYFECSVDYLLGRENDFGIIDIKNQLYTLSSNAKELIDIFNALDHMHQVQILEYARFFADRSGIKIKRK